METIQSIILCKLLTSHAYSHRKPHAYDMAMRPREFDAKWANQGWLGHREEEGEHSF